MFGGPPFGQRVGGNVNLSTASSTSFASLLDNVRAERQQREEQARVERAVRVIQGRWRAGRDGARARGEVVRMLMPPELNGGGTSGSTELDREHKGEGRGEGDEERARKMLTAVVISQGWRGAEQRGMRGEWARRVVLDGAKLGASGIPILLEPIRTHAQQMQSDSSHGVSIALALLAATDSLAAPAHVATANDPSTTALLTATEALLTVKYYTAIGAEGVHALRDVGGVLSRNGWVERVVEVMKKLIATNTPKKKNPALLPLVRLVLAPLTLHTSLAASSTGSATSASAAATEPNTASSILDPLLSHLLTIPSLPSSIPIPALTYLSDKLSLFPTLLPYAAAHPGIFSSPATINSSSNNPLAEEHGKTYFLANLVTFGITGQMLAHASAQGQKAWMAVLVHVLSGLEEGWGRWVEGVVDEDEVDVVMAGDGADSDESEDENVPSARTAAGPSNSHAGPSMSKSKSRPRQTRPLLPPKISAKLLLLPSPTHVSALVEMVVSPSAKAGTVDVLKLAHLAGELLRVFRGTPKWEMILDALLQGRNGRQLFKRLWRECVRGRWGDSAVKETWERFGGNTHAAPLRLLTNMYNHFLLLAPDDEFFDPQSNPLSMDEVLELSVIWRDLAFWGYMAGVHSAGGQPGMASAGVSTISGASGSDMRGSEEDRALFTRGVTRLTERNARRKFAPEEHWPMPGLKDLSGFVEAAVLEDAQLFNPAEIESEEQQSNNHGGNTRGRLAARQRFSKRQVAFMSPRLGLLNNLPMAVPFVVRLKVFDQLVKADSDRLGASMPSRRSRYYSRATIRRDRLAEDGFRTLNPLGPYLKGHIQITFINEFGEEEAGIDGGGLFKEFLTSLSRDAFDSARGLWLFTDQNELYPNPHSYATEQHQLSWYAFLGRVLGKAIYDGILVDVSFAGFFLAKWLGRQSYLDDLASLDKDLYKGLIVLKNYPRPEELALNFTITEEEFGMPKTIDLVPGGADIAVTAENRHEYIQLVCKHKLDRRIALQSRAFFNGLSEIVDDKWLRMFDQHELRQVIGGEESPIDVDDLRANTAITGFAHDDTVKLFWRVVKKFSEGEKRALVKFVTSCERPPLLGFGHLNPKFGIRSAGSDTTRLPSASSCFNLLKMPEYKDEKTLKAKLLQAITSGAGFDLS